MVTKNLFTFLFKSFSNDNEFFYSFTIALINMPLFNFTQQINRFYDSKPKYKKSHIKTNMKLPTHFLMQVIILRL